MRTSVRNPLDNVTARAVELSRDNSAADRMSGANGAPESAAPADAFTTMDPTTGATVGPFFWDWDEFDSANAVFGG